MRQVSASRDVLLRAAVLLAPAIILVSLGCFFSPQSARQVTAGVPPQKVQITAKQREFTPSEAHVQFGSPVGLIVNSIDVDHGIEFTDLDVPVERIPAGRSVTVKFIPNQPGTYHFKCAVVCCLGHDRMLGVLIVE